MVHHVGENKPVGVDNAIVMTDAHMKDLKTFLVDLHRGKDGAAGGISDHQFGQLVAMLQPGYELSTLMLADYKRANSSITAGGPAPAARSSEPNPNGDIRPGAATPLSAVAASDPARRDGHPNAAEQPAGGRPTRDLAGRPIEENVAVTARNAVNEPPAVPKDVSRPDTAPPAPYVTPGRTDAPLPDVVAHAPPKETPTGFEASA